MGILNTTPDSFYDGGKLKDATKVLQQTEKMLSAGAAFLDVGGYSSRPGANDVSVDEELRRVVPTIELILTKFPQALISVDTFRSKIAKEAIAAGASMINDISGGSLDAKMLSTVGALQVPYISMHLRGNPQNMMQLNDYKNVTKEVLFECSQNIAKARSHGINDVIVDPGFGFAKNVAQNFELFNNLELFKALNCPLLVGVSRKSMIYKTLKTNPHEALNGTTALHSIALLKGAQILRVHDVKEANEVVTLLENFKK